MHIRNRIAQRVFGQEHCRGFGFHRVFQRDIQRSVPAQGFDRAGIVVKPGADCGQGTPYGREIGHIGDQGGKIPLSGPPIAEHHGAYGPGESIPPMGILGRLGKPRIILEQERHVGRTQQVAEHLRNIAVLALNNKQELEQGPGRHPSALIKECLDQYFGRLIRPPRP